MTFDNGSLSRIAFALGLAAIGGYLADLATIPLPWMLGPMIICTLGAVIGLPIQGPIPIRPIMVMILGIMLGSGFSPEMLDQVDRWGISLTFLFIYIALGAALCYPFFRRVAGYDRPTAYFSAMPGGLNEMMIVGAEMGGDDRRIVLTHASRVLLAVLLIPIGFRFFSEVDLTDRDRFWVYFSQVSLLDYILLSSCLIGFPIAKRLKIPAPLLVGPMLASAVLHLSGGTSASPPTLIVNIAQWVMGTVIGCRFVGVARGEIVRTLKMSLGSTAILIGLTVIFGLFVVAVSDTPLESTILAYAPGGLAEMSLVALAMGIDVAFVATHHVVRIVYVIILAPIAYRWWERHRDGDRTADR